MWTRAVFADHSTVAANHTPLDELTHLFGCTSNLPQVPQSPLRLSALLDAGDPDVKLVEETILSDPALTAGVIKAASSAAFGRQKPVGSVKDGVMVLGQRALRSLAIALWTSSLVCDASHKSHLDTKRFAANGSFVGALASTIQRQGALRSVWSADELFAAGVLHNVLFGLLSYADPREFDRLYELAQTGSISLNQAFLMVHGRDVSELAERATHALGLPAIFLLTNVHISDPAAAEDLEMPISILNVAKGLAESNGLGLVPWNVAYEPSERVRTVLSLSPAELEEAVALARQQPLITLAA